MLVLMRSAYSQFRLVYAFLLGAFFQSMLGLWQFFGQSSFSSKWLGIALHYPYEAGVSVVESPGGRFLRAYGGLDHPNILGGFLAIASLVAIAVMIHAHIRGRKNEVGLLQNLIGLDTVICGAIFFTCFYFCLGASFSRSAFIAFLLGLAVLTVFLVKNYQKAGTLIGSILAITFLLTITFFLNYKELVYTRISSVSRLEQISLTERESGIQDFYRIFSKNYLIGAGIGGYPARLAKDDPGKPGYAYQPVHNSFLLIAGETGILGLGSFVMLLVTLIFYGLKSIVSHPAIPKITAIACISAILVLMAFDHWLWSLHFGVMFLFFTLGTAYKAFKEG